MVRFLTKDKWEGDMNLPITYNRWMYANANPVLFTDPTGRSPGVPPTDSFVRQVMDRFGISFSGNWTPNAKYMVARAVWDVGYRFDTVLTGIASPSLAFQIVYRHGVDFSFSTNCYGCRPKSCIDEDRYSGTSSQGESCTPVYGTAYSSSEIEFATFYENNVLRGINNVVHELGHAFDNVFNKTPSRVLGSTETWIIDCEEYDFPHRTNPDYSPYFGFASPNNIHTWQMNTSPTREEEFADTFLGWVYNKWETNSAGGLALGGQIRSEWSDQWFLGWLDTIVANLGG
jgi:hypothetical protein